MDTEEFSFPRISDNCAHNIDSPPLWNLSPAASPNPYQGSPNECCGAKLVAKAQSKSFSCVASSKRFGLEGEDNRMDLLWEDFNEELLNSTTTTTTTRGSATSSSREVVEFRCASSFSVSKANNNRSLVSNKNKAGMVIFVKVMKKLFSINNSQGKSRK